MNVIFRDTVLHTLLYIHTQSVPPAPPRRLTVQGLISLKEIKPTSWWISFKRLFRGNDRTWIQLIPFHISLRTEHCSLIWIHATYNKYINKYIKHPLWLCGELANTLPLGQCPFLFFPTWRLWTSSCFHTKLCECLWCERNSLHVFIHLPEHKESVPHSLNTVVNEPKINMTS